MKQRVAELEAERARFFDTIRAIAVNGLGLTDPWDDTAPEMPEDWARHATLSEAIASLRSQLAAEKQARESGKEPAYSEVEAERDRLQSELRKLKQERFHLAAANEQLTLSVKALVEGLKQIQWGNDTIDPDSGALSPTVYSLCPMCDQSEVRGHSPDCVVGALIAEHAQEKA